MRNENEVKNLAKKKLNINIEERILDVDTERKTQLLSILIFCLKKNYFFKNFYSFLKSKES